MSREFFRLSSVIRHASRQLRVSGVWDETHVYLTVNGRMTASSSNWYDDDGDEGYSVSESSGVMKHFAIGQSVRQGEKALTQASVG
jgi:hypothetical protein